MQNPPSPSSSSSVSCSERLSLISEPLGAHLPQCQLWVLAILCSVYHELQSSQNNHSQRHHKITPTINFYPDTPTLNSSPSLEKRLTTSLYMPILFHHQGLQSFSIPETTVLRSSKSKVFLCITLNFPLNNAFMFFTQILSFLLCV